MIYLEIFFGCLVLWLSIVGVFLLFMAVFFIGRYSEIDVIGYIKKEMSK